MRSHQTSKLGRVGSGYLDPLLAADLFRASLKRFVLITVDATCHSLAGMHVELPRRFELGSFYVFQIHGCS